MYVTAKFSMMWKIECHQVEVEGTREGHERTSHWVTNKMKCKRLVVLETGSWPCLETSTWDYC